MFKRLSSIVLSLAFVAGTAYSQTITASLEGTVQDSTKAIIAGAKVRVVNVDTNIDYETATDATGRFFFTSLPAGAYALTAEAAGFKKVQRGGITLHVNQSARVDVALEVGAVSESVEVTAQSPLLEATTSSVGQVIENRSIANLPLNERNPFALVLLVPGVTGSSSFNWVGANNFSVNGGRQGSNDFLLDGVPSAPPSDGINRVPLFPSTDAIQEFNVQTNNYSAEFGLSGGGVINLIFKSGTNQVHGSLYEFIRNSKFDANKFFNNSNRIKLGSFKRHQFGFSLGGPVVLPKVYNGANKTFFFMSYEGLRERSGTSLTATLPSELQRQGDFSQTLNSAGKLVTIYDPLTSERAGATWTRRPFPGNRIPAGRLDPVASAVAKYYPSPNRDGLAFTHANNFVAAGAGKNDTNQGDAKVDHNISDRQRFFVRISRRRTDNPPPNYFPGNPAAPGSASAFTGSGAALDYVLTATPRFLVNFRYGVSRELWAYTPRSDGFDPVQLGFPQYIRDNADRLVFPTIAPQGYYTIGHGNQLGIGRLGLDSHSWQLHQTKIGSRHVLRFGGEARMYRNNSSQAGRPTGDYSFSRTFSQGPNANVPTNDAGDGFATFLLGIPGGSQTKGFKIVSTQSVHYSLYLADDWKVTSKLTLNLGLRYELNLPRTERYDRMEYLDLTAASPLAGPSGLAGLRGGLAYVGTNGNGRRQFPTQKNLWAPRLGFAYQIRPRMAIRGAYGIFYALPSTAAGATIGLNGFRADTSVTASLDGVTPNVYLRNPFPNASFIPITGSSLGLMTAVGSSIDGPLPGARTPYTQNWNLGIQRELPRSILIDVTYVGSRGVHLGQNGLTLNQMLPQYMSLGSQLWNMVPNPFYGLINTGTLAARTVQRGQLLRPFPQFTAVSGIYASGASSTYHSLQMKVQKRLTNGLTLLAAYTNAKLIDDASQTNGNVGREGVRQNVYDRRSDRALSPLDVSQRLVMSYTYELPFGKGRKFGAAWNRALDIVLGGWQVNGVTTFERGLPLALSASNVANAYNPGGRPNNNGSSARLEGSVTSRMARYFNTSVFSQPVNFTFGNTGRTLPDVRLDGGRNFDLSLFKNIRLVERCTAQFRAEGFNMFNTPRFSGPDTSLASRSFGNISGTANNPRQMQFSLKLLF